MDEYFSIGQVARRYGVRPQDVSNLFYTGKLRGDLCPIIAGRRLVPADYLEQVEWALQRAGKLPGKGVSHAK